jgi:hypothetical protein
LQTSLPDLKHQEDESLGAKKKVAEKQTQLLSEPKTDDFEVKLPPELTKKLSKKTEQEKSKPTKTAAHEMETPKIWNAQNASLVKLNTSLTREEVITDTKKTKEMIKCQYDPNCGSSALKSSSSKIVDKKKVFDSA